MNKKSSLPKPFQKMLGQLKRLDDELGISIRPYGDKKETWERGKRKERETLLGSDLAKLAAEDTS